MITDHLKEVLAKEGIVSIVSWAEGEAHVCNTWNSYVVLAEDGRLLMPAWAMRATEKNTTRNPRVKLTLGSKEVQGYRSLGTGYLIEGQARFISEGPEWTMMKERFSFLTRVIEVTPTSVKQTL